MNKYILFLFSIVLFITSCSEEKPPGIDLGGLSEIEETSYVAPIEAKQDKVVLIEELTGVQCVNCVEGAQNIKTIINSNPGRVLAVASHPYGGKTLSQPKDGKSKYDFRNNKVDEIMTILGGYPNLPSASIDRKLHGANYYNESKGTWVNDVTPLIQESTPVNIEISSLYNVDNNNSEVIVKVAFTESLSEELYLTIYVLENDIEDHQSGPNGDIPDYKHMHVFRDCITSVAGTSLNFADKNAGTVLQKRLGFSPVIEGDNAWNLDNCKILAFVHKRGTDQSVLHAQEISLK